MFNENNTDDAVIVRCERVHTEIVFNNLLLIFEISDSIVYNKYYDEI